MSEVTSQYPKRCWFCILLFVFDLWSYQLKLGWQPYWWTLNQSFEHICAVLQWIWAIIHIHALWNTHSGSRIQTCWRHAYKFPHYLTHGIEPHQCSTTDPVYLPSLSVKLNLFWGEDLVSLHALTDDGIGQCFPNFVQSLTPPDIQSPATYPEVELMA